MQGAQALATAASTDEFHPVCPSVHVFRATESRITREPLHYTEVDRSREQELHNRTNSLKIKHCLPWDFDRTSILIVHMRCKVSELTTGTTKFP